MSPGNNQPDIFFAGQSLDKPVNFSVLGGEVVLFTHSSPTPRHDNEDAVGVFEWGGETTVLVVADGLGGLPQGGEASRQVVESLWNPKTKENVDPVVASLEAVNESLVSGCSESGTTVSVVTIAHRTIRSYHVGDSAVLVVGRRGRVKLQTTPHSAVGLAFARGYLDEKAAIIHPNRHVINNMIGMSDMWIDVGKPIQLARLDTTILASDGLWDNLYQEEVVNLVCNRLLIEAAEGIVQTATDRMKHYTGTGPSKPDDLSFILYRPKP